MTQTIIAGNWKMNLNPEDGAKLAKEIADGLASRATDKAFVENKLEVLICPPSLSIVPVLNTVAGSVVKVGAQNMHHEVQGAFTGEISGEMLVSTGCYRVILGHSERRHVFNEGDAWINRKMHAAIKSGLKPILCVGETETERDENLTINVVERQIRKGLLGLSSAQMTDVVIAYEPVWAIGTGRTASPEQAQEVHLSIRKLLMEMYPETASEIPLLYGGSVKPANVSDLLSKSEINGALVGGASLKSDSFLELVSAGIEKSRT